MVSMVSSFKRGGWDSFPYVVVLGSCVECSSDRTSPWLVWSAASSFKRGGWDRFPCVVVLGSCVGCSSSRTSPWLVWSAVSKEEGGIDSRM